MSETTRRSRVAIDVGTTLTTLSSTGEGPTVIRGRDVAGAAPPIAERELVRRFDERSATVLEAMLREAARAAAEPGREVAATLIHPAQWDEHQLQQLEDVASRAGLTVTDLVSAPAAAAAYYVSTGQLRNGDAVAVYDWGDATFTATVVRIEGDAPRLLGAPQLIDHLGGLDVDQLLLNHVEASLGGAMRDLDWSDPAVRGEVDVLRDECRSAKELLSTMDEVDIPVRVGGVSSGMRVTRADLDGLVRPFVAATLAALDRAIQSAQLNTAETAAVVLSGGCSRLPVVAAMVAEHSGRPLLADVHPEQLTVLGALATSDSGAWEVDRSDAGPPVEPAPFVLPPPPAGPLTATNTAASIVAATAVTAAVVVGDERDDERVVDASPGRHEGVPLAPAHAESLDAFDAIVGTAAGGQRPASSPPQSPLGPRAVQTARGVDHVAAGVPERTPDALPSVEPGQRQPGEIESPGDDAIHPAGVPQVPPHPVGHVTDLGDELGELDDEDGGIDGLGDDDLDDHFADAHATGHHAVALDDGRHDFGAEDDDDDDAFGDGARDDDPDRLDDGLDDVIDG